MPFRGSLVNSKTVEKSRKQHKTKTKTKDKQNKNNKK